MLMITQTFKRWLHKLFAWWPWHGAAETSYAQPSANLNTGVTQDTQTWPRVDGAAPLPSSIAVDHNPDAQIMLPTPGNELQGPIDIPDGGASVAKGMLPTAEQRMEFLRYLMKHGMLNEGFEEGQIPEQYRRKNRL